MEIGVVRECPRRCSAGSPCIPPVRIGQVFWKKYRDTMKLRAFIDRVIAHPSPVLHESVTIAISETLRFPPSRSDARSSGVYYWQNGSRNDKAKVRLETSDDDTTTELYITGVSVYVSLFSAIPFTFCWVDLLCSVHDFCAFRAKAFCQELRRPRAVRVCTSQEGLFRSHLVPNGLM